MRRLVACASCKRQYDASKLQAGTKFRCRCGSVMKVVRARDHDSKVVRCSSCGGPREKNSIACSHCGSDFTLHDRDLHTICAHCQTRVSDKARYCHSCGTPIVPEETMGESTSSTCPACRNKRQMHSRRLGDATVSSLECDGCAGLWLGIEVFEHLAKTAKKQKTIPVFRRSPRRADPDATPRPKPREGYRPCPVCRELMNRRNYGLSPRGGVNSGTVIDYCRDHGIWFDNGELAAILEWLREGGSFQVPGKTVELPKPTSNAPSYDVGTFASRPIRRSSSTFSLEDIFSPSHGSLLDDVLDSMFGL